MIPRDIAWNRDIMITDRLQSKDQNLAWRNEFSRLTSFQLNPTHGNKKTKINKTKKEIVENWNGSIIAQNKSKAGQTDWGRGTWEEEVWFQIPTGISIITDLTKDIFAILTQSIIKIFD